MNNSFPHELLSAYFDGELAPEERAEVERLLETSAEARRELAEIGEISNLLRSLPKEEAPVELAGSIHRRAEREMLLAESSSVAANSRSVDSNPRGQHGLPGSNHRSRRGSWIVAVGGSVTAAAGVLLALQYASPPPSEPHPFADLNDARSPADVPLFSATTPDSDRDGVLEKLAEKNAADPNGRTAMFFDADGSVRNLPQSDATNGVQIPRGGLRDARREDRAAIAKSLAEASALVRKNAEQEDRDRTAEKETVLGPSVARQSMKAEQTAQERGAADAPSAALSEAESDKADRAPSAAPANRVDITKVRIGEVIPYLEGSGDRVAVIEVTVVDVQKALGKMQVLLSKNAIPVDDGESPNAFSLERHLERQRESADKRRASGDLEFQFGDELFAVYVETTGPQLASALDELQQQELFGELKLQPPMEWEEFAIAADGEKRSAGKQQLERFRFERLAAAAKPQPRATDRTQSAPAPLADDKPLAAKDAVPKDQEDAKAAGASASEKKNLGLKGADELAAQSVPQSTPSADGPNRSYHRKLKVPATALHARNEAAEPDAAVDEQARAKALPSAPQAAGAPPAAELAQSRARGGAPAASIRVVFVFQPLTTP